MLIIFDIDGTLCNTHDVDAQCFAQAVEAVSGHSLATVEWSRYPEATGSAIVSAFLFDLGDPTPGKTEQHILSEFVSRLETEAQSCPELFRPMDGAFEIFREIRVHASHKVAIATGCWAQSAQFKLRQAGFDVSEVPFASSSDTPLRKDIIALAAKRAGTSVKEAVYVGDGPWDFKATRELGMRFIGIGRRHQTLRDLGAEFVFPSFQEKAAFFHALTACA